MSFNLKGIESMIRQLPGAVKAGMEAVGNEAINIAKEEAPGKLGDTVQFRIKGSRTIEIFSTAPHAVFVEKGRGGFSVKNAKAIRFTSKDGTVVFCKSVGPAKANPFMARTRKRLNSVFQNVFEKAFFAHLSK